NGGPIKATFSNGVAAHNGGAFNVGAAGSGQAALMVAASTISNSGNYGLVSNGASSIIRVTRSRITGNNTGLLAATGIISSYGDNNLDGNTTDGTFNNTISAKYLGE